MADIGTAVRGVIAAASGVSTLVSTRVYPDVLPQGCVLPAIRYAVISDRSEQHMTAGAALAEADVQVDCYAQTRLSANSLANTVRLALARYKGTSASVVVRQVLPGFGRTDYEEPQDASDLGRYVASRDYTAWYVEDIA